MTRFIWATGLLLSFSFSSLATEATFSQKLRAALSASPLSAEQRVQHVFNRLGYGTNVSGRHYSQLLKLNAYGDPDDAKTNEAIITFLSSSLLRRVRLNNAIQQKVNESYPEAALSAGEVDASWRALARPYYDKNDELNAIRKEIAAYTSAVPPKPVPATLLRKEELALQQRTDLQMYITEFSLALRAAEQAEQVAYSLLDESPLIWVMLDFWFNHFNVSTEKDIVDLIGYREQIASHMFGKFSDLLLTTARHPAMLVYLDNGFNRTGFKKDPTAPQGYAITVNPNENFAREVMELHSLGQGPSANSNPTNTYNQNDIRQVALLLSGWNLDGMDPRLVGPRRFHYIDTNNAPITKTVMGHTFAKGYMGGVDFLNYLGNHPLTAGNISKKLVRHFVTENTASPEYINLTLRLKNGFLAKDGDLLMIYQDLIGSHEFWSKEAFRSKVKQPLNFVASSLRASGLVAANLNKALLANAVSEISSMGQRLLICTPPTGYSDSNEYWMSTSNALNAVQYAYRNASFSGEPSPGRGQYYSDYEAYAASLLTPSVMGYRGMNGMVAVYDFRDMAARYGYPDSVVSDFGLLQSIAGNHPDRGAGARLYPIRTVLGLVTGSADFIRN